jgi:hypothetical protein
MQAIGARLNLATDELKDALRTRDDAIKDQLSLYKAVASRDKKSQEYGIYERV